MTARIDRDVFAARARESGVPLTEEDIDTLLEGYGLLQRLVTELDRPTDFGLEPALVFKPVRGP